MAFSGQRPDSLAEIDYPIVSVIMGSDSDLPHTMGAYDVFDAFEVPYQAEVVSAHRTPEFMHQHAEAAAAAGYLGVLSFAGGSSHLQGMTASETIIPVYGVAIEGSADPLSSSFGSQLRMPSEAPLAVMGKNEAGAINGALQIVRTLALVFPDELKSKLEERRQRVAAEVMKKNERMREIGPRAYNDEMMDKALRKLVAKEIELEERKAAIRAEILGAV